MSSKPKWARSEYYGIGATIVDCQVSADKAATYILATFEDALQQSRKARKLSSTCSDASTSDLNTLQ